MLFNFADVGQDTLSQTVISFLKMTQTSACVTGSCSFMDAVFSESHLEYLFPLAHDFPSLQPECACTWGFTVNTRLLRKEPSACMFQLNLKHQKSLHTFLLITVCNIVGNIMFALHKFLEQNKSVLCEYNIQEKDSSVIYNKHCRRIFAGKLKIQLHFYPEFVNTDSTCYFTVHFIF